MKTHSEPGSMDSQLPTVYMSLYPSETDTFGRQSCVPFHPAKGSTVIFLRVQDAGHPYFCPIVDLNSFVSNSGIWMTASLTNYD